MPRYIDADAFVINQMRVARANETEWQKAYWEGVDDTIRDINNAPTADVAPVVHGRWERSKDDYFELHIVKCSVCREEWCFEVDDDVFDLNYHFCPNCGAKMDGERRNDG